MPRSRQNILLNFQLKNEASRANLNKNKRIFKWRPFWNKVYTVKLTKQHHSNVFISDVHYSCRSVDHCLICPWSISLWCHLKLEYLSRQIMANQIGPNDQLAARGIARAKLKMPKKSKGSRSKIKQYRKLMGPIPCRSRLWVTNFWCIRIFFI